MDGIDLRDMDTGAGPVCRSILDDLPQWFGIAEAVDEYVRIADVSPTVVAATAATDVGFVTLLHHSAAAAEIHSMGVRPAYHRRGIGRLLLAAAERRLADRQVEFLQVKTLSPARADEGYERTRAFYRAQGFRELEEFPDLWDPSNPALQLIKVVGS